MAGGGKGPGCACCVERWWCLKVKWRKAAEAARSEVPVPKRVLAAQQQLAHAPAGLAPSKPQQRSTHKPAAHHLHAAFKRAFLDTLLRCLLLQRPLDVHHRASCGHNAAGRSRGSCAGKQPPARKTAGCVPDNTRAGLPVSHITRAEKSVASSVYRASARPASMSTRPTRVPDSDAAVIRTAVSDECSPVTVSAGVRTYTRQKTRLDRKRQQKGIWCAGRSTIHYRASCARSGYTPPIASRSSYPDGPSMASTDAPAGLSYFCAANTTFCAFILSNRS